MAKINNLITVAIDNKGSAFHFYTAPEGNVDAVEHQQVGFSAKLFDDEFYVQLKQALKDYAAAHPSEGVQKVTMVLPDEAVLTDIVTIPTLRGFGQTKKSLDATLSGIYRNFKELKFTACLLEQNKQNSTFMVAAVGKSIITKISAACSENKLLADVLTFAANTAVCGAAALDPKLKSENYLLMDVKENHCRFVFVGGGKALGFYDLPFGMDLLRQRKVVPQEELFDHSYARLVVSTAKEKANSRKMFTLDEQDKKSAPQKPLREERLEKIRSENLQMFGKWALMLIADNRRLTAFGKPDFICVNLPGDNAEALAALNGQEGNDIPFCALAADGRGADAAGNLELFGGLNPKNIAVNKF